MWLKSNNDNPRGNYPWGFSMKENSCIFSDLWYNIQNYVTIDSDDYLGGYHHGR